MKIRYVIVKYIYIVLLRIKRINQIIIKIPLILKK